MSRKDFPSDRPPGALAKQVVLGLGLAVLPIIYGVVSIQRGYTTLGWPVIPAGWWMKNASPVFRRFPGVEGIWLAVAYIALGVFCHFHYFWGHSDRECLWRFSDYGKNLASWICVASLIYAVYLRGEAKFW